LARRSAALSVAALAGTKSYRLIKGEAVETHAGIDISDVCSPDSGQAGRRFVRGLNGPAPFSGIRSPALRREHWLVSQPPAPRTCRCRWWRQCTVPGIASRAAN